MKYCYTYLLGIGCLLFLNFSSPAQTNPTQPNVLLIIADDLGQDAINGYFTGNSPMPTTPHLDSLRNAGVTFMNAWAAPQCTPTRATIMSGKYGINNGVQKVPGTLDPVSHTSVFKELASQTSNAYDDAVIGKWHIDEAIDYTHPNQHGVDFYTGLYRGDVTSYYSWEKVLPNGTTTTSTTYATEDITDEAISWVTSRTNPWFLWLAYNAPHSPFEVPPAGMYSINNPSVNFRRYVASIEALDYQIGELLDAIPPAVENNTMIIFLGDNGTPNSLLKTFPTRRGKGSVYQGGVNVPFFVSGAGVSRTGAVENAMINATDIYATVVESAGGSFASNGIYNSHSFYPLLSNAAAITRPYNYIDYQSNGTGGDDFAIRDDQYKLIQFADGTQEFYDLIADPFEQNNLLPSLTSAQQTAYDDLETEAIYIRTDWSCRDLITNGAETSEDTGGTYCAGLPACVFDNSTSTANIGCCATTTENRVNFMEYNGIRTVTSTNMPDHEYCYNTNPQAPVPVFRYFEMPINPTLAAETTPVANASTKRPDIYFGVGMNGVKLAPAPATPFIFENTRTGEYNWSWIFEPTNNQGAGSSLVGLDCASAHTGPQGYHYHGNMFEYAENIQAGLSTTTTPPGSPVQIGWAADGFPILYRFAPNGAGGLTLLQPSYQLKAGDRPGDGVNAPCGPYNGKYTNDYEYLAGTGDLDECNGIQRDVTLNTVCGPQTFNYFYVVTDAFPQISRCLSGTPDITFDNDTPAKSCFTPLTTQEVTLNAGQSITVGSSSYNAVGTYQDRIALGNGCDSIVVTKITAVLPLELLAFDVKNRNDKYADLRWITISEENVSHFEIQRSLDGENWDRVGEEQANNSVMQSIYSYRDYLWNSNPVSDFIYYRLKIIDLDNSYEYSPVKYIQLIKKQSIHIFQDYDSGEIFMDVKSESAKTFQVEMIAMDGKLIFSKNISLANGRNRIFNDISNLSEGIYIISVRDNNGFFMTERIIIQGE